MAVEELPEDLLERVSAAAGLVKGCSQVRVISHYDADGISSAGILTSVLLRENIRFQVSMVKSLERELVNRLAGEGHECIIFSDMGSGLIDQLDSLDTRVVVLDHHKPPSDSERVVHINPHL
jgi:RecJ-like exonuclease